MNSTLDAVVEACLSLEVRCASATLRGDFHPSLSGGSEAG